MKSLDLATLGVEEMNEAEMRDVDGGQSMRMYNLGTAGCWLFWTGSEWGYAAGSGWVLA